MGSDSPGRPRQGDIEKQVAAQTPALLLRLLSSGAGGRRKLSQAEPRATANRSPRRAPCPAWRLFLLPTPLFLSLPGLSAATSVRQLQLPPLLARSPPRLSLSRSSRLSSRPAAQPCSIAPKVGVWGCGWVGGCCFPDCSHPASEPCLELKGSAAPPRLASLALR